MNRNNFDALRLFAAGLVLVGHSHALLGLREPLFLSWLPLGPLGVYIFFTISGYLISESWDRDPHLLRYFWRRALRIFPGLAVCVLLSILVLGPVMTTLPTREYFANPRTWEYLQNIGLYIIYYLPGVFEHLRVPNAVNGSLWSLPVEFLMYIVLALLGLARANRWIFLLTALAFAWFAATWAMRTDRMLVVYNFDLRQAFLCGTYFWMGAVFYKFQLWRYFSLSGTLLVFVALLCLEPWPHFLHFAGWLLLAFLVLSFGSAYSPLLGRLTRSGDYSYGLYIYAFPIQQSLAYLLPQLDFRLYLLICALATLTLAVGSWHLVEKRALTFKPVRPRAAS